MIGSEKTAVKLDAVVLFLYSRKVARGYYETEFRLVTDHAKETRKFEITDKCNRLLEQQILEQPEFWLSQFGQCRPIDRLRVAHSARRL